MLRHQTVTQENTDEELIAAFQKGQVTAFNILVGKYKDQLINFVYRFLGNYDEADDVVQETFIRVYRNKYSYKPIAKFSTWIYTIAANLAKTQIKRKKHQAWFSLSRHSEEDYKNHYEIPDSHSSPEQQADSIIIQEIIQNAINSIGAKYREVIILFDIQEMSYEEISKITGLNIGTVKSRLNRGRKQLQLLLKDIY